MWPVICRGDFWRGASGPLFSHRRFAAGQPRLGKRSSSVPEHGAACDTNQFCVLIPALNLSKNSCVFPCLDNPKDPAVLKILRVVNLLRVVFLIRRGDLLSRHTLRGHHFPGNYRHSPSQGRVYGVVNLGRVVKTLRHSNSLFLLSS